MSNHIHLLFTSGGYAYYFCSVQVLQNRTPWFTTMAVI